MFDNPLWVFTPWKSQMRHVCEQADLRAGKDEKVPCAEIIGGRVSVCVCFSEGVYVSRQDSCDITACVYFMLLGCSMVRSCRRSSGTEQTDTEL